MHRSVVDLVVSPVRSTFVRFYSRPPLLLLPVNTGTLIDTLLCPTKEGERRCKRVFILVGRGTLSRKVYPD